MHRQITVFAATVWIFLQSATAVSAQSDVKKAARKGEVNLVSSVKAVAPGRSFDVALHFKLASGWHIYWQNSGDSGLPPNVKWLLPDGFAAGRLRFPVPKRHHSAGEIVTNIHEGEPILLARITPPAVIGADRITLAADVKYLICKSNCVREEATVGVELSVDPPGAAARPDNEDLFRRARGILPKQLSKYVSVTVATQPKSITAGRPFELQVNVDIKRGYHIQSHEPTSPNFIKCDVFLERTKGILYGEAVYPKPKFRTVKYLGKLSEYAGRVNVRIPGEVDEKAPPGPWRLGGVVTYQACNNKGTCFPPEALEFAMPVGGSGRADAGAAPTDRSLPTSPAFGTTGEGNPAHGELLADAPSSGDGLQPKGPSQKALPAGEGASSDREGLEAFLRSLGLPGLLLGCFVYGLFINATPCVLPLLSIKVLGFVQQAHESRARTMALGTAFGLGVMIFFVILGFLAAGGTNLLHYPVAVIALGAVVMVLALSMLGVYTLQVPTTATMLDASIQKEGVAASFGKGALAPVLGFACTGPLMAGMFGWATQQPRNIALIAFLVTGIGMASPYMLLGAFPKWLSFLPRPGNWMITFERIMGFLLLVMVIWLLHPLSGRVGAEGLEWTLGFFVVVAMACWILGKVDISMAPTVRWKYRGGAAALVVISAVLVYGWFFPLGRAVALQRELRQAGGTTSIAKIAWRTWSKEAVEEAVLSGHTVFVDFTADYCTNCKINKKAVIYHPATIAKIEELDVIPFQADFSDGDAAVFAGMQKYNRPGPPLNIVYPPGRLDNPIVMTPLFSLSDLLAALDQAGPSRVASRSTTDS